MKARGGKEEQVVIGVIIKLEVGEEGPFSVLFCFFLFLSLVVSYSGVVW